MPHISNKLRSDKLKVSFFGGAQEVGRSCILIETEKTKVLLDAGVKLGREIEMPDIDNEIFKSLDAIVLSHAHLDHIGYLPHIYSSGYRGFAYATKPTTELTNVLISDYMHISNPKDVTKEGLKQMMSKYKIIEYMEEFKINELTLKFIPAGHILGSAMIHINDGKNTLLYTGDINTAKTKLFDGTYLKDLHADTLIIESTYGGKDNVFDNEKNIVKDMMKSIKETINKNGKIIIPSFAAGRAQEVLLLLDDHINSGIIPKVPIYVDGMINKAMRIHRHNVIYCRKELQSRILMSDYDPFKSKNFYPVERKSTRNKIIKQDESCIIVTTSGMITGGPVLFYLSQLSNNNLNKIMMVGYQANGTRGRELQDGAKTMDINDSKIEIKMDVETYHLSAHADRRGLESVINKISGLKNVFIVHGEKSRSESLKEFVDKKGLNGIVPQIDGTYEINN